MKTRDKSYIRPTSIPEYFGNTVVLLEDRLCYLTGIDVDPDGDGWLVTISAVGQGNTTHMHRDYTIQYFDDIFEFIEPWIPDTFWAERSDDQQVAVLFTLVKPTHYKRSADNERYHSQQLKPGIQVGVPAWSMHDTVRLTGLKGWRMVDRDIYQATELAAQCGSSVVSPEFCVAMTGNVPVLMYKDQVIGYVNSNGGVRLHPSYMPHFNRLVSQFAEVV